MALPAGMAGSARLVERARAVASYDLCVRGLQPVRTRSGRSAGSCQARSCAAASADVVEGPEADGCVERAAGGDAGVGHRGHDLVLRSGSLHVRKVCFAVLSAQGADAAGLVADDDGALGLLQPHGE